uniref:Uncharacterized protein n=1 Tax=Anguilla anguilla TaxID=7936 RepID=A0A0E9SFI1_ANGAN
MVKRIGPRTDPCGTPFDTGRNPDWVLPDFTH